VTQRNDDRKDYKDFIESDINDQSSGQNGSRPTHQRLFSFEADKNQIADQMSKFTAEAKTDNAPKEAFSNEMIRVENGPNKVIRSSNSKARLKHGSQWNLNLSKKVQSHV